MAQNEGFNTTLIAGIILAIAALAGIIFENTASLAPIYDKLLSTQFSVALGDGGISKPVLLWINDGLMAIFFLFVALEIKREAREGALTTWSQAAFPVYGALGGIAIPALVFTGIVGINSAEISGWAIPAATDIAFALGVLGLFGSRVPGIAKTFLLTLAVVDDLAAIVIIALFYTSKLSLLALGTSFASIAVLILMNRLGIRNLVAYLLVGVILWVAVLKSGVHATLAGVALGFAIPLAPNKKNRSAAKELEHDLYPLVSFIILPIFAFANSGVPLKGLSLDDLLAPLSLGIAAGLFIGKQLGIMGTLALATRFGLAKKPSSLTWPTLYGVACLAGIGFTMSLFIGGLAFSDAEQQNMVRIGVLSGSLLSALMGSIILAKYARVIPLNERKITET